MNQSSARIISFCQKLEPVLDDVLFRTKQDEDAQNAAGKSAGPAIAAGTGAALVGAGGYGAHRSIMKNYGGAEAGAGQAYRNAGRNAVEAVAAPVKGALARGGAAYTTAREVGGLGPVTAGLRAGKKALNPALARLRGVLGRVARV